MDEYDHVVLDTRGDLGGLTLAALRSADAALTVFTSDPGSALGVVRVAAFLEQQRGYENTDAVLLGAACSAWDKGGRAARQVLEALQTTGVPLMRTMVPLSRRVPSSTLDKLPVVLAAPTSPVASAYRALADELRATAERTLRSPLPTTAGARCRTTSSPTCGRPRHGPPRRRRTPQLPPCRSKPPRSRRPRWSCGLPRDSGPPPGGPAARVGTA